MWPGIPTLPNPTQPHHVPNADATYVWLSASGMEEPASRDQDRPSMGYDTHINYCWLFNDRWLILYPVKRLDVMYEISSSTQSSARGQEQQDPRIHVLKRNGFDRCTTHRSMCSTSDGTHLHTQDNTGYPRSRAPTQLLCMYTPSGFRCVYFPTADSFVHSQVFTSCTVATPSAELPESCAYFGAAERLYACKYFMLHKASKLSFWHAG